MKSALKIEDCAPLNKRTTIEIFTGNSMVWMMTDQGLKEKRILRISTESRGIIGDIDHTVTQITYTFEDGTCRDSSEVFASKQELIASL